jgi:zinc protease
MFFRFCLIALLSVLPLQALGERVTDFTLENGMQVVVIEDRRAPVVVHMVWYRVGAADEPPGKSGIAHFFEHLMFKGTEQVPSGAFSRLVSSEGGSDNAFTSWDYTAYFQRVATDRLDLVMGMEADRMTGLTLDPDEVLTERSVVLEERAQRTESDPQGLFDEHRMAVQFLNHPYGRPIIGWRHEIEALTREDALAFYKAHYAPDNAILIVAGDVGADEVRALAQQHYGTIPPKGGFSERRRPSEPPQLAERRLTYADERVGQPYVIRSYLAPSRQRGAQEKAAALVVLADLLGGNSATSFLGRALEFERKIAVQASAFYMPGLMDDTLFSVAISPVEGVTLDAAEAALDEVLAEFLEKGIDPADFERLMRRLRAQEIYALDNTQRVAREYGMALASGLSVEDQRDWPRILQSVTPEDVMAAAHEVFDRRRAVTARLVKEEGQ